METQPNGEGGSGVSDGKEGNWIADKNLPRYIEWRFKRFVKFLKFRSTEGNHILGSNYVSKFQIS